MIAASFKLPSWTMVHKDFSRGMCISILLAKAKIKNSPTSYNRELVKIISIHLYNSILKLHRRIVFYCMEI